MSTGAGAIFDLDLPEDVKRFLEWRDSIGPGAATTWEDPNLSGMQVRVVDRDSYFSPAAFRSLRRSLVWQGINLEDRVIRWGDLN